MDRYITESPSSEDASERPFDIIAKALRPVPPTLKGDDDDDDDDYDDDYDDDDDDDAREPLLGPSWDPLGLSGGASWAVLGPSWAVLARSWAVLGPSRAHLGPF